MTSIAAPEKFSSQGVLMIVAGMLSGGLVAYGLRAVSFPPEPAGIFASGAALLPPAIANYVYKRRRGLQAELTALSRGFLVRPVSLVVAMVAGALLLATQVVAFIVGVCIGIGLEVGANGEFTGSSRMGV